ncbi:MAG: SDR family oxidoreductase [Sphingobium sp.]|nr:SDR family oxidoreductase [Sphingobium sp.]
MSVSFDFTGKCALVTGGASGIGRASAMAFAAAGAQVALIDLDEKGAAETVGAIKSAGGNAEYRLCDVADETQVGAMVQWVADHFGRLDIAHNNAGIEGANVPLVQWPGDDWRRLIDVNLNSVFYCLKAEIAHMQNHGGGAIINTSSVAGLIGGFHMAAYNAAKHGVIGLTKVAAMDYATQSIRVNALCPGLVDTPFIQQLPQSFRDRLDFATPMSRPGKAEEMAQAVLWLSSDAASYVTGHALVVDGGTSLGGIGTRFDDLIPA